MLLSPEGVEKAQELQSLFFSHDDKDIILYE